MNEEPVAWMVQVIGGVTHKWDLVWNKPTPKDLYDYAPLYSEALVRQQQEKITKYELRHAVQRDRIAILEAQLKKAQEK